MAQADASKLNMYAALRPYPENTAVVTKMAVYVIYNTQGSGTPGAPSGNTQGSVQWAPNVVVQS